MGLNLDSGLSKPSEVGVGTYLEVVTGMCRRKKESWSQAGLRVKHFADRAVNGPLATSKSLFEGTQT